MFRLIELLFNNVSKICHQLHTLSVGDERGFLGFRVWNSTENIRQSCDDVSIFNISHLLNSNQKSSTFGTESNENTNKKDMGNVEIRLDRIQGKIDRIYSSLYQLKEIFSILSTIEQQYTRLCEKLPNHHSNRFSYLTEKEITPISKHNPFVKRDHLKNIQKNYKETSKQNNKIMRKESDIPKAQKRLHSEIGNCNQSEENLGDFKFSLLDATNEFKKISRNNHLYETITTKSNKTFCFYCLEKICEKAGFKCIYCDMKVHKYCKLYVENFCEKSTIRLNDYVSGLYPIVPRFVTACIEEIESRTNDVAKIYLSPLNDRVKIGKLALKYVCKENIILKKIDNDELGCMLIEYIWRISPPLVSNAVKQAAVNSALLDDTQQLKNEIELLSIEYRHTLATIVLHIKSISKRHINSTNSLSLLHLECMFACALMVNNLSNADCPVEGEYSSALLVMKELLSIDESFYKDLLTNQDRVIYSEKKNKKQPIAPPSHVKTSKKSRISKAFLRKSKSSKSD